MTDSNYGRYLLRKIFLGITINILIMLRLDVYILVIMKQKEQGNGMICIIGIETTGIKLELYKFRIMVLDITTTEK